MMDTPKNLKFTKTHEWVKAEGETVLIGITDFAQAQLSDLTYVELPSVGDTVAAQDEVAVVESVKAASDIYAPLGGEVLEVNEKLVEHPELINSDPYGEGWFFSLKPENPSDVDNMLSAEQYDELLPDED